MKILWFTWKDLAHPLAGGAEVVNHELAKRLIANGHEVTFIVGGFDGASATDDTHGYHVVRMRGGRFSVYWHAYRYYCTHLKGWADVCIDEINTIPFFCRFYVHEKHLLFVHQLAREIWFYEMPFPFSLIGYIAEPIYLWLLRKETVVTVSESSKNDLMRFGFEANNVHIISEGIEFAPLASLSDVEKYPSPTILSLGAIRAMKRTDEIVKAFEIAKGSIPNLQLLVAGKAPGAYGARVLNEVTHSRYHESITYLGPVSKEKKLELLQKAHVLAVTSLKEGWGLVVTEANSQGTPAVVYDVDGLRDSVQNGSTGVVTNATPKDFAYGINTLFSDQKSYATMQQAAWQWSKEITFDTSYQQFLAILTHA